MSGALHTEELGYELEDQDSLSAEGDLILIDTIDMQDPEPLLELVRKVNQLVAPEDKSLQATVSLVGDEQWQSVLKRIVPKRLLERGLGRHMNILVSPQDKHYVLVGPSAISNVAEQNKTGYSEVVYTLLTATGRGSNEVLERGCNDILAREISKRSGMDFYTKNYPGEAEFVLDLIRSFKPKGDKTLPWVIKLKADPDAFFEELQKSEFYHWWERFARKKDALSQFVQLFESLKSPSGQLEGSFLQWAQICTRRFAQYRQYREDGGGKK
jgi:hypothetical protein